MPSKRELYLAQEIKDPTSEWKKCIDDEQWRDRLFELWSGLLQTTLCEHVLQLILDHSTRASIEKDSLCLFIPWSHDENVQVKVCFRSPWKGRINSTVPLSYAQFLRIHNGVSFHYGDDEYPSFSLNGLEQHSEGKPEADPGWEGDILEEGDDWILKPLELIGKTANDVSCVGCYDAAQNWIVLHPFYKNSLGESALCLVSHESCEISDVCNRYGLFGFLLRQIVSWILNEETDCFLETEETGSPMLSLSFQVWALREACLLGKSNAAAAKLISYNWFRASKFSFRLIEEWFKYLNGMSSSQDWTTTWTNLVGKQLERIGYRKDLLEDWKTHEADTSQLVKRPGDAIRLIDLRWDDTGSGMAMGFDWHFGENLEGALSQRENEISYFLDWSVLFIWLGKALGVDQVELSRRSAKEVFGESYEVIRSILGRLSMENFRAALAGWVGQELEKTDPFFAVYSKTPDQRIVVYNSIEPSSKEWVSTLFPDSSSEDSFGGLDADLESKTESEAKQEGIAEPELEIGPETGLESDLESDLKFQPEAVLERDPEFEPQEASLDSSPEQLEVETKETGTLEESVYAREGIEALTQANHDLSMAVSLMNWHQARRVLSDYGISVEKFGVPFTDKKFADEANITRISFIRNLLKFLRLSKDASYVDLLEKFLQNDLDDGILSFEVACYYAEMGSRLATLKWVRQAIGLGLSQEKFLEHSSFAALRDDAEFLEALNRTN